MLELASISLNWMASVRVVGAKPRWLVVVSCILIFLFDVLFHGCKNEVGHRIDKRFGLLLGCVARIEQCHDSAFVCVPDGWAVW
jgi:hypothetical protein